MVHCDKVSWEVRETFLIYRLLYIVYMKYPYIHIYKISILYICTLINICKQIHTIYAQSYTYMQTHTYMLYTYSICLCILRKPLWLFSSTYHNETLFHYSSQFMIIYYDLINSSLSLFKRYSRAKLCLFSIFSQRSSTMSCTQIQSQYILLLN